MKRPEIIISGINFSHDRLFELWPIVDNAEPFYRYIEKRFRALHSSDASLDELLKTLSKNQLKESIKACLQSQAEEHLYDGLGQPYSYKASCTLFFAWIVRDAPKQRLAPLLARLFKVQNVKPNDRDVVLAEVFTELLIAYRSLLRSFTWETFRETVADRLEGSRRSLIGHRFEEVVRKALQKAFEHYWEKFGNKYFERSSLLISDKQVKLNNETYDLTIKVKSKMGEEILILVPVKSRETEGGGHAYLFTRDLKGGFVLGQKAFIVPVIIATNWDPKLLHGLEGVDPIFLSKDHGGMKEFPTESQEQLNQIIEKILGRER